MAEEWGKWVEHDGKPAPQLMGLIAQVQAANGMQEVGVIRNSCQPPKGKGSAFIWSSLAPNRWHFRIVQYRLRRPDALRELIDLVENLPAPALDTVPREGVPA